MTTRRQLQNSPQGKHRPRYVQMGGLETYLRNVPYGTKRVYFQLSRERDAYRNWVTNTYGPEEGALVDEYERIEREHPR